MADAVGHFGFGGVGDGVGDKALSVGLAGDEEGGDGGEAAEHGVSFLWWLIWEVGGFNGWAESLVKVT